MRYLLDTCVLSEFMKPNENRALVDWFDRQNDESLFISVLAIGEIRKGITKLGATKRADELRIWLDGVLQIFDSQILSYEIRDAIAWGDLKANLELKGRPLPVIDSLMAATALVRDLTLVTRNGADFANTGVRILNPWDSE